MSVNYDMVIPLLVEAVKVQQAQLTELADLEAEVAELRQLVHQMSNLQALPVHELIALNGKD